MENRTKKVEQLLMWSKQIDKNKSNFNIKMYNKTLNTLKFEQEYIDEEIEKLEAIEIIKFIERLKKLPEDYYKNRSSKRGLTVWRQTAMTLIQCNTKLSQVETGKLCGNRDHSTVIHGHKTIDAIYDTDKFFKTQFDEVLRKGNYKYMPYEPNK